jgi:hypothetical protein
MLERLLAATENGSEWRMKMAAMLEWLLATTNFQPRPICHDCRPSDLPNAELPNAV